jgi:hypothetical protein
MRRARSAVVRRLALGATLGAAALAGCQTNFLLPAEPGTIGISYSFEQGDLSPFAMTIAIDGEQRRAVSSLEHGTLYWASQRPGKRRITITGVPSLCSGSDQRTVSVTSRDTVEVAVAVKCPPRAAGAVGQFPY